jgi:23S rRNA pseudouridine1911/1915/1917 synthase
VEILVSEEDHGRRLDETLARLLPQLSRMRLRRLVLAGEVLVNGVAEAPGRRLQAGDRLLITGDLAGASAMTPEAIPLTVWREDEHLIVVEKPAGTVVHPAGRHASGTLANALAHHFNVVGAAVPPIRPGLVHRLDRATSGLMVVAKTQAALSRLTVQFQERRVRKAYLALVHGRPTPPSGVWDAPIGAEATATPPWGIRAAGRPAQSRYAPAPGRRFEQFTLLELEPLTGRTNQLRLHAAHFGHPIAGDDLFGRGPLPGLDRLFLHAARLEFTHPATGEAVVAESPLPPELRAFLGRLAEEASAEGPARVQP